MPSWVHNPSNFSEDLLVRFARTKKDKPYCLTAQWAGCMVPAIDIRLLDVASSDCFVASLQLYLRRRLRGFYVCLLENPHKLQNAPSAAKCCKNSMGTVVETCRNGPDRHLELRGPRVQITPIQNHCLSLCHYTILRRTARRHPMLGT